MQNQTHKPEADPNYRLPPVPVEYPIKFYYVVANISTQNLAAVINDEIQKGGGREYVETVPNTATGASPQYTLLFKMDIPEGDHINTLPGQGSPTPTPPPQDVINPLGER